MTTPAEEAAALEASIQHWTDNIAAETPEGVKIGPEHCALCNLFWQENCLGCPVMARTGRSGCRDTPYGDAKNAYDDWTGNPNDPEARAEWITAATAERDFLVSLRKDPK